MPPSVIVIGGGIIGCATDYELAKAGCRVTLFERATPGADASSAAAHMASALVDGGMPDLSRPFLPNRLLDRSPHAHTR